MRYYIALTAILLIGISVFTACEKSAPTVNTAKTPATETAKTNTAAPTPASEDSLADAPRISLADAKKAFDEGSAVFVDTRAEVQYQLSHIKGAINVPAEAMETRYKEIPTGKKIIAYCSWPAEHTSAGLVAKLKEKGIENAFALLGGTDAWKNAGYPMESSEASKSEVKKEDAKDAKDVKKP